MTKIIFMQKYKKYSDNDRFFESGELQIGKIVLLLQYQI